MSSRDNDLGESVAHLVVIALIFGFIASIIAIFYIKTQASRVYQEDGFAGLIGLTFKATMMMIIGSAIGALIINSGNAVSSFTNAILSPYMWMLAGSFALSTVIAVVASVGAKLGLAKVGFGKLAGPVSTVVLALSYSVAILAIGNPSLFGSPVSDIASAVAANFIADVVEFARVVMLLASDPLSAISSIFVGHNGNQFQLVKYWPGAFTVLAVFGFLMAPFSSDE